MNDTQYNTLISKNKDSEPLAGVEYYEKMLEAFSDVDFVFEENVKSGIKNTIAYLIARQQGIIKRVTHTAADKVKEEIYKKQSDKAKEPMDDSNIDKAKKRNIIQLGKSK